MKKITSTKILEDDAKIIDALLWMFKNRTERIHWISQYLASIDNLNDLFEKDVEPMEEITLKDVLEERARIDQAKKEILKCNSKDELETLFKDLPKTVELYSTPMFKAYQELKIQGKVKNYA